MICKIRQGSSVGGAVNYIMGKHQAELLDSREVRDYDKKLMTKDFEAISNQNPEVKKWVFTVSVSFHKQDEINLSDKKMVEVAKEILNGMGFSKSPYIVTRHYDGANPHFHILTSRVDTNGKTVSDSFCKLRINKIRERLELKYPELTSAKGKNINDINIKKLKGKDAVKYKIYTAINVEIKKVKNINDLAKALLKNHGIVTEFKYRRGSIDIIEGIKFNTNNTWLTGSKVDKMCSYENLVKQIENNQELGLTPKTQNTNTTYPKLNHAIAKVINQNEPEYLPNKKRDWTKDNDIER